MAYKTLEKRKSPSKNPTSNLNKMQKSAQTELGNGNVAEAKSCGFSTRTLQYHSTKYRSIKDCKASIALYLFLASSQAPSKLLQY
jgi:hypothetical protein